MRYGLGLHTVMRLRRIGGYVSQLMVRCLRGGPTLVHVYIDPIRTSLCVGHRVVYRVGTLMGKGLGPLERGTTSSCLNYRYPCYLLGSDLRV